MACAAGERSAWARSSASAAAAHQQQPDVGIARDQQRHRCDQIVQPLIGIEAADEAEHRLAGQPQRLGARGIGRHGRPEQLHVHAIGRDHDLVPTKAARDQVVAQALADHRHRIRLRDRAVFHLAGEPVFGGGLAAGTVADRRILPEGADFIEHWQAQAPPGADRGEAVQRGRVRVQDIGLPDCRRRLGRAGERRDIAPFAQPWRPRNRLHRPMKGQAVMLLDRLDFRAGGQRGLMPDAGHAAHLQPGALLCGQDRARAETVAAVERQAMVKNVQDPGHGAPAYGT